MGAFRNAILPFWLRPGKRLEKWGSSGIVLRTPSSEQMDRGPLTTEASFPPRYHGLRDGRHNVSREAREEFYLDGDSSRRLLRNC